MEKTGICFCYLSGEIESKGIPSHEIIAILKSNDIKINQIQMYDQVLIFRSDKMANDLILNRAAYVHECGEVIFTIAGANRELIEKEIQKTDFDGILKNKSSYAVRVKKIKSYYKEILEEKLEREIGNSIKSRLTKSIQVNLKNPECLFIGIFTETSFIFGISSGEGFRSKIRERAPHTRPFFHPCGLDPILARAMINLAEVNPSKMLMDPFCGSGSILMEASLMGFKAIGSDISLKLIKGAILNLRSFLGQDFYIIRADARCLPLQKINCVVTDPPYGRSTHIEVGKENPFYKGDLLSNAKFLANLLSDFFRNTIDIIKKESLCVIALPSTFEIIHDLVASYNFKIQHEFDYYIHRSLTRNILVLEKM